MIKKQADLTYADITPKSPLIWVAAISCWLQILGTAAPRSSSTRNCPVRFRRPSHRFGARSAERRGQKPVHHHGRKDQFHRYRHPLHNNYYEFGTDKDEPSQNARTFNTSGWKVSVEGECAKPRVFTLEEILKLAPLEERVYRHRCVEAWSIVVPWIGYSLSTILNQVQPTSKAKFVSFQSYYEPKQMPLGGEAGIPLPYVEGLRLDEAMNPLALVCVGMYGETLPNQDGAPVRLILPWKYGFKSIKSIVKIRLVEKSAAEHLEPLRPDRVWLLFQRESAGRSPALEPGQRAPPRRIPEARDAHVQRLRRLRRLNVCRHGPSQEFLAFDFAFVAVVSPHPPAGGAISAGMRSALEFQFAFVAQPSGCAALEGQGFQPRRPTNQATRL